MTPPNKPEWIHLAETDSAPRVKKSARALPALVLAAAMSIVGLGALVAQNGAETPAISSEQGINLSTASMPTGGGDDDDDDDDDDDEDDDEDEDDDH